MKICILRTKMFYTIGLWLEWSLIIELNFFARIANPLSVGPNPLTFSMNQGASDIKLFYGVLL
jgi:hypothetical protein